VNDIQKIVTFIVTHIVRPYRKIVSVLKTNWKGKQAAKYQEQRKKATLLGLLIYQISPSTVAFPLQKV
jgi:hypothetical protein